MDKLLPALLLLVFNLSDAIGNERVERLERILAWKCRQLYGRSKRELRAKFRPTVKESFANLWAVLIFALLLAIPLIQLHFGRRLLNWLLSFIDLELPSWIVRLNALELAALFICFAAVVFLFLTVEVIVPMSFLLLFAVLAVFASPVIGLKHVSQRCGQNSYFKFGKYLVNVGLAMALLYSVVMSSHS